jgi:hypothetical protein
MSNDLLNEDAPVVTEVVEQESPVAELAEAATQADDFRNLLPEDLRDSPSLKDIKSVGELAKSYEHAQHMIGGSVRVPTEEASEEAWQDFYGKLSSVPGLVRIPSDTSSEEMQALFNKLGRPESPEGYTIELDPEVAPLIQGEVNEFTKIAHEAGLTKQQVDQLAGWRIGEVEEQMEAMAAQHQAAKESLQQKWGQDYDNRMRGAKAAARHYANEYGESFHELLNSPAGNHPALIEILSKLGESMQESNSISSNSTPNGYGMTPAEAAEKLADFWNNAEMVEIYKNISHPGHKALMAKIDNLYRVRDNG